MGFFSAIGSFIMTPLYYLISAILVAFYNLFGSVFGTDTPAQAGVTWVLAIIAMTIIIRAALMPLFVKQIKSTRNMQILQPQMKELQRKYKHDREKLTQETMALYRETGTNPLSSCLPLLLQMPIFFALFRLINHASNGRTQGVLNQEQVDSLKAATLFGAKISDSFTGGDGLAVKALAAVLVLLMIATTFLTQRQLMAKNMPPEAMTGPFAQQQKMMLYVLPLVFGIGGIAFPIGVLLYWTTSNAWTMGQQFYVIRNNPAPNTDAARAKAARDAAKAARRAEKRGTSPTAAEAEEPTATTEDAQPEAPAQRYQPRRKSRRERRKGGSK